MSVKINNSAGGSVTLDSTTTSNEALTLPTGGGTLATTATAGVDGIVSSANATAITIDANENIGIGVVPESGIQSDLSVLRIGSSGVLSGRNAAEDVYLASNSYYDTSWASKRITANHASTMEQINGQFKFKVAPLDTAGSTISWTNALEIKNDGRGLSQFTAKAWLNFNGVANTIRDSHNVSSIVNTASGRYTVNFSNNIANTTYSVVGSHNAYVNYDSWDNGADFHPYDPLVGSFKIVTTKNGSYVSAAYVSAQVFGD